MKLTPRLIVHRSSSPLVVHTLHVISNQWAIDENRTFSLPNHPPVSKPILFTVLDAKTGEDCVATPTRLAMAIGGPDAEEREITGLDTYWVVASQKEMRSLLGLTGDKVSKTSFGSAEHPEYIGMIAEAGE